MTYIIQRIKNTSTDLRSSKLLSPFCDRVALFLGGFLVTLEETLTWCVLVTTLVCKKSIIIKDVKIGYRKVDWKEIEERKEGKINRGNCMASVGNEISHRVLKHILRVSRKKWEKYC